MSITQSTIHANLNRDKILSETCWLYYCCCGGVGLNKENIADPLIAAEVKELCLRATCTTTSMTDEEGLCHTMAVMCCITEQCQIPPMEGYPKCVCFNKVLAKGKGTISYKTPLFDYKQIFDDTFWVYYMFCYGCGVSMPGKGRPLIAAQEKFLIVKGAVNMEAPVGSDGTFCAAVATECCLWSQCQFPPAPNNPMIALCGWRKNKGTSGASEGGDTIGKPSQVEMS